MIAFAVSALLVVISAFHLLWALGIWVPFGDETRLARAVVGSPGITQMPGPVACAVVAVALFFLALLPHLTWVPFKGALLGLAAVIFAVRGIAAFVPAARRLAPEQPFSTYDKQYYAPLCLILGWGFALLAIGGT